MKSFARVAVFGVASVALFKGLSLDAPLGVFALAPFRAAHPAPAGFAGRVSRIAASERGPSDLPFSDSRLRHPRARAPRFASKGIPFLPH